jgi:hypothetical protein
MSLILQTILFLSLAIGHTSNPDMPFATKFAESQCGPRSKDPLFDSYRAKALIPKEAYSQKNIESLFRWYLKKHERDTDMLHLEIHIEDKTYRASRICDSAQGVIIEPPLARSGPVWEEYKKELEKQKLYSPIATFSRGRRELIIRPEYLYRYWWTPDPSKPDDLEIVNFKP